MTCELLNHLSTELVVSQSYRSSQAVVSAKMTVSRASPLDLFGPYLTFLLFFGFFFSSLCSGHCSLLVCFNLVPKGYLKKCLRCLASTDISQGQTSRKESVVTRITFRLAAMFTWNHPPLQPSKCSVLYLLLPPRSAPRRLNPSDSL